MPTLKTNFWFIHCLPNFICTSTAGHCPLPEVNESFSWMQIARYLSSSSLCLPLQNFFHRTNKVPDDGHSSRQKHVIVNKLLHSIPGVVSFREGKLILNIPVRVTFLTIRFLFNLNHIQVNISLQLKSYTSKYLKIILTKNKIYIQFHASSTYSVAWQPFKFGLGFPFGLLKIIIFTEWGCQPHAPTPTWRPRLWFLGVLPQGGWQMPKKPTQTPCFGTLFVWLLSWDRPSWMTLPVATSQFHVTLPNYKLCAIHIHCSWLVAVKLKPT